VNEPVVSIVVLTDGHDDDGADTTARSIRAQVGGEAEAMLVERHQVGDVLVRARGELLGILDAGDLLDPDAIARLLAAIRAEPGVDLAYSDEDVCDRAGRRSQPFYKPAWSPDRLRCQPYTGRLTLLRGTLVAEVGGWRPELGGAAEHDLVLRVSERARSVVHVASPLCHRRAPQPEYPSFPPADTTDACRSVDEHLRRVGIAARARPHHTAPGLLRLEPALDRHPLVSVVVPTAGTRRVVRGREVGLVANCVRSVIERSTYPEIEIVCVVDPSVDAVTRDELVAIDPQRVRLVDYTEAFHFSRKINQGVLASGGEVVVLLNDDTEIAEPGWVEAMLIYALDPSVGAVGARLLFEDDRIQHAGVVAVRGNPGHPYYGAPRDTIGHGANALVPGDYLAVTAACLMTRRATFDAVGGLSSWFPVNYNDIDYCLKVRQRGLRVVATPDAVLHHYESSSRSGDVATRELELVRRRWGRWLRDDPFYGPNFPSGNADFVPASVDGLVARV
jgi:GT2 family glycosyltransferase